MNITLKRSHILFCLSYIPNLDSNKNYKLLEQINTIMGTWDGIEPTAGSEVVTLNIKGETLAEAWHVMSQQPEGKTATVAREMSQGSAGFDGLESQLQTLAFAGEPDAMVVINKVQFLGENYAQQRAEQLVANLVYLKEIFV